uniref:Molybdate-anion transporter n=1 Tax=Anas platyrhynchos TaxID=8839 RepID=A0A8B9SGW7_ANAPL
MLLAAYTALALLLAAALGLELAARRSHPPAAAAPPGANPAFARFQRGFLRGYLPALAADWLQGPYLYKLYQHYGFVETQIAVLYVCGFASSVLFGPVAASLVDALGRRASCVLFSLTYSACCLTKLSRDYLVLAAGRVLGGLSTALLFCAFEAWYVHEHVEHHDFPAEWVPATFSQAAFWNHVLAVGAGVVANAAAEWLGLGPVAPFVASIPLLVLAGAVALKDWDENYGKKRALAKSCADGLRRLVVDRRVLLLGTVQALFESVIYIFVFLWTPVLDPHGPPLGIVFSSFMAASMVGASLYRLAVSPSQESPSRVLCGLPAPRALLWALLPRHGLPAAQGDPGEGPAGGDELVPCPAQPAGLPGAAASARRRPRARHPQHLLRLLRPHAAGAARRRRPLLRRPPRHRAPAATPPGPARLPPSCDAGGGPGGAAVTEGESPPRLVTPVVPPPWRPAGDGTGSTQGRSAAG